MDCLVVTLAVQLLSLLLATSVLRVDASARSEMPDVDECNVLRRSRVEQCTIRWNFQLKPDTGCFQLIERVAGNAFLAGRWKRHVAKCTNTNRLYTVDASGLWCARERISLIKEWMDIVEEREEDEVHRAPESLCRHYLDKLVDWCEDAEKDYFKYGCEQLEPYY